jgi:multiple sugar transport system substrate-binding protein
LVFLTGLESKGVVMKRRSIVKYAAVAAALSLGLTACGGGSGSSDA